MRNDNFCNLVRASFLGVEPLRVLEGNEGMKNKDGTCNFCGKTRSQVTTMIKGKNAFICNECVFVGFRILVFPDKLLMDARIKELESKWAEKEGEK